MISDHALNFSRQVLKMTKGQKKIEKLLGTNFTTKRLVLNDVTSTSTSQWSSMAETALILCVCYWSNAQYYRSHGRDINCDATS